ncbi:MAG: DoxX family membrane protein [Tannerellaceae bacterium]|jgi:thiosulfate dehydrogenase [quinone] large subunit|nr:DoxX family membrane protein [Tannerellaceae bacterium]
MNSYSNLQRFWLVALRLLVGWHFLYEGLVKVLNPKWTSLGYLMDSQGWFASLFHALASNQGTLSVINFLNEWGLILIGLSLILGCLTRLGCIGGMLLLLLYYFSHPPFIGSENLFMLPREGAYLWVDRNLIEIAALGVLYIFPTSRVFGLDGYILNFLKNKPSKSL